MTFSTRNEEAAVSRVHARLTGLVWITQNKVQHYPDQMETTHLQNTLKMINDGRMTAAGRTHCSGLTIKEWGEIFQAELDRRFNAKEKA
jgi:hypothetical protein